MFTNKSYIPIKPHLQVVISIVELLYYQKAIMENSSLYYILSNLKSLNKIHCIWFPLIYRYLLILLLILHF